MSLSLISVAMRQRTSCVTPDNEPASVAQNITVENIELQGITLSVNIILFSVQLLMYKVYCHCILSLLTKWTITIVIMNCHFSRQCFLPFICNSCCYFLVKADSAQQGNFWIITRVENDRIIFCIYSVSNRVCGKFKKFHPNYTKSTTIISKNTFQLFLYWEICEENAVH